MGFGIFEGLKVGFGYFAGFIFLGLEGRCLSVAEGLRFGFQYFWGLIFLGIEGRILSISRV